jgi:ABC-type branched-subunit amino acid transport system substrate-binding protein
MGANTRKPKEEFRMLKDIKTRPIGRRTILKLGIAVGAMQVASPFVVKALGEVPVKIGLDDPFTGTYAELGKNEQIGSQLAVDEINKKGGILGRQVALLSEDSTSTDTGTAVQKVHKLIDRDKVNFILGNVNSAMALAIGDVTARAGVLHIVTGGHTDAVTGTDCHCSASATRRAWKPTLFLSCCSISLARSGISSRRTTPSGTRCRRVSKQA